jgi:hypothetical protein
MTRRFIWLTALLISGASTLAAAADVAILTVHFDDPAVRTALVVEFAKPLPAQNAVVCAASPCQWAVSVIVRDEPPKPLAVTSAQIPVIGSAANFGADHLVVLTLKGAVPADYARVVVTYLRGSAPTQSLAAKGAEKPPNAIVPVEKADDATLSFQGIGAPASGGATTYSIDAKAAWILARLGGDQMPLSVRATAKSDKRPEVDLDSFSTSLTLWNYAHRVVLNLDLPTVEFNRKASVINVVPSARVIWPLSTTVTKQVKDPSGNDVPTIRFVTGVDLALGAEVGWNTKNTVTAASGIDNGSGGIARLVPGVSGFVAIPTRFFKRIVISGEAVVRLLATDELFLETRDLEPKADPVASLDRRARPFAKLAVKFMASPWIGFQLGYEYGSVPPAFKMANHSGTIGFVFQAKQNERSK